ncbi:MAG TPA: DUF3488 and transglutaminase-like domain-containing protein [Bdellovibrionales bacterium]|nr:DUF3488 and transglutaminase-like domain-containing protein [Bdellovibrionales bacterium]
MSTNPRRHELHPLAGRHLTVLLLTAAVPLLFVLPAWVPLLLLLFLGWRYAHDEYGYSLPTRFARYGLVAFSAAAVFFQFTSLNGYEPATSMLLLLGGLKLLETVSQRDIFIVTIICWLLAGSLQLFEQSTFFIAAGLITIVLSIITLTVLNELREKASGLLTITGGVVKLFLIGLPIGLLNFVVFPRLSVQTFGLGLNPQGNATSGFSDSVDPGSVAQMVMSDEVVMRVTFTSGAPSSISNLYWRGAALDRSEGLKWKNEARPQAAPQAEETGIVEQIVTLEPQKAKWLFALDLPVAAEWVTDQRYNTIRRDQKGVLSASRSLFSRTVYKARSTLAPLARLDGEAELWTRVENPERWPKTLEYVRQVKTANQGPDAIAAAFMNRFLNEGYTYSLQPGVIPEDSLDYFLFTHKKGFCEHYAATFATMMRLAGVPARVVSGFQGGAINELGGFIIIKNRDAHSWAEYFSPGRGWVRVDPVSVVAPERLRLGAEAYFNQYQNLAAGPALLDRSSFLGRQYWALRAAYEAFDFRVTQFLLEFDFSFQQDILEKLGVDENQRLALWLAVALILAGGALYFYVVAKRRARSRDELAELFARARKKLHAAGVMTENWEAPATIVRKLERIEPKRAAHWRDWLKEWEACRYGAPSGDLPQKVSRLKKALRSA